MGGARMMVMKMDGELMPELLVAANRIFEQALLKVSWKFRPELQCRSPHLMLKTQYQLGHFILPC
jgi:hypothetical protein